jgi:hypothetical protein
MRKTLKHILAEYGAVAVVVYLVIFTLVLFGFWAAIRLGWRSDAVGAHVGAFTAAYLATKVTQPLRIGATLLLTPAVARLYERVVARVRPRRGDDAPAAASAAEG